MRYWLLLSDEPAGPYTAEDLDQIPGFSRASLVYPEKRLDPRDERWLAAGDVPQLAVALAAVERRAFAGRYILPEPTVRDLPVLGSILKQLERFEEELVELRSNLIARHQELVELRGDSDRGVHRHEAADAERKELEQRIAKIEPLQMDILHLREASLEAAQSAQKVEDRLTGDVTDLQKRLEHLEGNVDTDAVNTMMRMYTATLQERIDEVGKNLKHEHDDAVSLRGEFVGFRDLQSKQRSERGFLAGGTTIGTPEKVVFFLIALLAGAIGYLFYTRIAPVPVPIAVVEPKPEPEPVPPPPEPVTLKPAPEKKKPRIRRTRKSSQKRAIEKQKEKQLRQTILLRVTGGVPSSKKAAIAERRAKPLPAPEPKGN